LPERSVETEWLAYFDRLLPLLDIEDPVAAYDYLTKSGLSRSYWLEYVFLSYVNHQSGCIYLGGYPNIRKSLPHGDLSSPDAARI
jgi:hypothetical protein